MEHEGTILPRPGLGQWRMFAQGPGGSTASSGNPQRGLAGIHAVPLLNAFAYHVSSQILSVALSKSQSANLR